MTLDDVEIVFTASPSAIGWLIRAITRSNASHVLLRYFSSEWESIWALESTIGGVRMIPAQKIYSNTKVVVAYRCKFNAYSTLWGLSTRVGDPFDYSGIFLLGWFLLLYKWLKIKIRYPLHTPGALKCSELVALMFKSAKLLGTETWNVETITPEDLWRFCEKNPYYFEKI